jgi:type IV pilus assembly protein PilA
LAACLIDSVLAAGTKSGYTFASAATPFVAPSTTFTSFTAGAAPLSYNKTGVRRFCAGDDGVLRQDPNTAGSIVVPAQPWDVNCTAAPWLVLQ